jgi:ADP-heptose:LPS heptosyltransferase/GT2 family glycosyltransferase
MPESSIDPGQAGQDVRIEIDPEVRSNIGNGLHNFWVRGRVSTDVRVDEVFVMSGDRILCRTVYGLASDDASPAGSAAREYYFFANLSFAGVEASTPFDIAIAAQMQDGTIEQESFTLCLQSIGAPLASVVAGPARLSVAPQEPLAPFTLSVETATVDSHGRVWATGWALSIAPIVTVQFFSGDKRIGAAQFNQPREDVARVYPRYPNAEKSGFSFVSATGAVEHAVSNVRIQALNVRGFAYEAAIRLQHQPPASQLIPRAAPEASRPPAPYAADHDPRRAIEVRCDELKLTRGGHFMVAGWALCRVGVSRVEIRVDGKLLGEAELGLPRPDVAKHHSGIAMARFSGFRFAQEIGAPAATEPELELTVYNGLDDKLSEVRTLYPARSATPAQESAAQSGPQELQEFRLEVDMPRLENDAVKHPVSGMLTIQGWSLAQFEVKDIQVFVDGVRKGEAHYGLSRKDVAAAFPNIDRALRSGYVFLCSLRGLETGIHVVKVCATSISNETAVRQFSIYVEHDASAQTYSQLREIIHPSKASNYRQFVENTDQSPRFVVVLRPSNRTGIEEIKETINSLRRQIYENWRLVVIAGGAKAKSIVQRLMEGMDKGFSDRVDVVNITGTKGHDAMPRTPREGRLKEEKPTFYSFLYPGDRLSCEALSEVALLSLRCPEADMIYADESRLSPVTGERDAFFKPDWSPDLLLSTNYIGRPWFVTDSVLRRSGFSLYLLNQNGEYNCVLNCTEHASNIRHIAKVLCHRGSADLDEAEVERRALLGATRRRGLTAEVVPGCVRGTWRVRRAVESNEMVSIIIPTCAAHGFVKTCIESLREKTSYRNFEIISVDNIPEDQPKWKAWLRQASDQVVEVPESFNWSRFNNIAASHARGKFTLFLNDDIEIIQPQWLEAMLEHAQRAGVGVVGAQLVYPDRKVQHAGMFLSTPGIARHAFRMLAEDDPGYFGLALTQRNVIAVTGACMLIARESFAKLGGFDEAHAVINNDLDYCLRAHAAGQLIIVTPYAKLIHHEVGSRDKLNEVYESTRFLSKWRTIFAQGDPYFNPRLSIHFDDYRPDDEPVEEIYCGHSTDRVGDIRSILVMKLDHIGDFITAIPAIRSLKSLFAGATLHVLASRAARPLVELGTGIDGFIEFEFFHSRSELGDRELSPGDFRELSQRLEPYNFDLAVDLRMHPDTRKVLEYVPARIRAGYDQGGQFPFLDIALEWERDAPLQRKRMHVSDGFMNLVAAIGTAINPVPDRGALVCADRGDILARLPAHARRLFDKPVAAIHPGVGNPGRQWPVEHFASLADLLVEKSGVNIVIIGSPDERSLAETLLNLVINKESISSLVGETSLKDLPQLLKACALYVGNNSGPKHIAAGLGIPTIGIHSGVVDATEWGPLGPRAFALQRSMLCKPCYLVRAEDCPRSMACVKQLEPAIVYQYADGLLTLNQHGRRAARGRL